MRLPSRPPRWLARTSFALLCLSAGFAVASNSLRSASPLLTVAGYLLAMASAVLIAHWFRGLSSAPAGFGQARVRWRLLGAGRVLCGRPVAYKVEVADGGGITLNGAYKAVLMGCSVTGSAGAGVTVNSRPEGDR